MIKNRKINEKGMWNYSKRNLFCNIRYLYMKISKVTLTFFYFNYLATFKLINNRKNIPPKYFNYFATFNISTIKTTTNTKSDVMKTWKNTKNEAKLFKVTIIFNLLTLINYCEVMQNISTIYNKEMKWLYLLNNHFC